MKRNISAINIQVFPYPPNKNQLNFGVAVFFIGNNAYSIQELQIC